MLDKPQARAGFAQNVHRFGSGRAGLLGPITALAQIALLWDYFVLGWSIE